MTKITVTTVLDLPVEQQKKLANKEGKSLAQWRNDMSRILGNEEAELREFIAMQGKRPEGWTEEDEKRAKRFQTIVDSEGPGWLDEHKKLAAQNGKTLEQWLEDMRKELE